MNAVTAFQPFPSERRIQGAAAGTASGEKRTLFPFVESVRFAPKTVCAAASILHQISYITVITDHAAMAQAAEHIPGKDEVTSSNLFSSSNNG